MKYSSLYRVNIDIMKVLLSFILIVFTFSFVAINSAWAFNIEAQTDRDNISSDENLTLTITITSEKSRNLPNLNLPGAFKDFSVLAGPNQSTSVQIINFKMSSSKTIQYILAPTKQGKLTIPSFSVAYNGSVYKTEPIIITVSSAGSSAGNNTQGNNNASAKNYSNVNTNMKKSFFRIEPTKKKVYIGEEIPLQYVLYSRENIVDLGFKALPQLTGFWVENIKMNKMLQARTTVNGRQYNRVLLKQQVLFPTSVGDIEIEPVALSLQVTYQSQQRRRSMFDDFFNDPFFGATRTKTKYVNSLPVNITVEPLPEEGKPVSFKGLVGEYSLKAKVNRKNVMEGDSITYTVTISGKGNINTISEPVLPEMTGFKVYNPTVKKRIRVRSSGVSGRKVFEYILIPNISGKLTIPPIKMSFFSPKKGAYQTIQSKSIIINAKPSDKKAETPLLIASSTNEKQEVTILGKDINFIKLSSEAITNQGDILLKQSWFWLLQAMPLLLIAVFVGIKKRQEHLKHDVARTRYKIARNVAGKHLKNAYKALKKNDNANFFSTLDKGITAYLANKLNLAQAGLTSIQVQEALEEKNVENETINIVLEVLQKIDFARFAPFSPSKEEMENSLNKAKTAIKNLERSI